MENKKAASITRGFFIIGSPVIEIDRVIRLVPANKSLRARLIPCRSQGSVIGVA